MSTIGGMEIPDFEDISEEDRRTIVREMYGLAGSRGRPGDDWQILEDPTPCARQKGPYGEELYDYDKYAENERTGESIAFHRNQHGELVWPLHFDMKLDPNRRRSWKAPIIAITAVVGLLLAAVLHANASKQKHNVRRNQEPQRPPPAVAYNDQYLHPQNTETSATLMRLGISVGQIRGDDGNARLFLFVGGERIWLPRGFLPPINCRTHGNGGVIIDFRAYHPQTGPGQYVYKVNREGKLIEQSQTNMP